VDALVSHVDLFPTICEVAGLTPPPWLQGVPLWQQRDEVFAEVNWHASIEPMRSVRTKRYKYIRRYAPRPGPVLPNCDDSPGKNALRAFGWETQPVPAETLYDLAFDPNESCNCAGDAKNMAVLADMRARLDRWMRETGDPLLNGKLEPWPGMVVNPVDDESPNGLTIPATASIFTSLNKP
jgi:N-sulfoglucosamine sulfohydrolase